MSFGSMKLTHADGTMHHLGIDETMVAKRVLLTPLSMRTVSNEP